MNLDALYSKLLVKTGAKLTLIVLDGLGDLATGGPDSSTPLEAEVELMYIMCSTPLIWLSSGAATVCSSTSAEAPG